MLPGNQCPIMNKELSKAIMNRLRLRTKFLKIGQKKTESFLHSEITESRSEEKTKTEFYGNEKGVIDGKSFWKTVRF